MGRGVKFGKEWRNSGEVPLLIASSALSEGGGKTQGLSALSPLGPQSPDACGVEGEQGKRAEQSL